METLRAELARAKEQARSSNAAALKAAEELRAEKAAHCESKEKMAKMVVELKDRLAKLTLNSPTDAMNLPVTSSSDLGSTFVPINDAREEALSALVALGYKPPVASKVIQGVYQADMTSEQLIREALRAMV